MYAPVVIGLVFEPQKPGLSPHAAELCFCALTQQKFACLTIFDLAINWDFSNKSVKYWWKCENIAMNAEISRNIEPWMYLPEFRVGIHQHPKY